MATVDQPTGRTGTDGFALIAVLAVLALLSGLVIAMLMLSRNAVDTAVISRSDLRTDAMVQSGLAFAGYQLFVLRMPAERVDGQQIRLDQGIVTLSVASESGKVDLNGSGKDLLAAAYRASGLAAMAPEAFAARVIDWRDADDEVGENGAEAGEYSAAGLDQGPRNSPFRSVDDLRWVLGLSPSDVRPLREFVTIYNPNGRLDVFSAPGAIITVLPNVPPEIAAEVLKVRRNRSETALARLADLLLVQSSLIDATPPATFRVRIDAQPASGSRARRITVILAAGTTPATPYHILNWSE